MKTQFVVSVPLLLALFLSPIQGFAQASESDRAAARALGKEGHVALDKKDWVTAADRFSRANKIIHAPTFLLGVAKAHVGLGKWVRALEIYNQLMGEPLPENAPAAFVNAVETAKTEAAALGPLIPRVVIQVTAPGQVEVTIDGTIVSTLALGTKLSVDPGTHVIRAEGAGFQKVEVTVSSVEGKTETVTLEPKPAVGGESPNGANGAEKQESAKAQPNWDSAPSPGKSGKVGALPPLEVKPSATPQGAEEPAKVPGSTQRTIGIVGLVVGGVGLGLGAATGGMALSQRSEIARDCPNSTCSPGRYTELTPALNDYRLFGMVSTISFIAGGVLAGVGGVLVLTAPKSTKLPSARVAPMFTITTTIGPGYAGAVGSFQ